MSSALWYAGRGTGLVSLVLFTVVVVLGIATRSGRPLAGLPRFGITELHRNVSLTAVVFPLIHVTTLLFDPYAQLRVIDFVVPFQAAYRPLWQGMGTVAFDLVLAIVATSLLRHRIRLRAWRAVHWLAYLMWPVAMVHGLGTGTDSGTTWLRVTAGACAFAVAVALAWRVSTGFTETGAARGREAAARTREAQPLTVGGRR
jgi:sulfoxide reductase heme-binding subunit YedZ